VPGRALRLTNPGAIAASIFLDVLNVFLFFLRIFASEN
jgi:FtsH-binding integral membrane protein